MYDVLWRRYFAMFVDRIFMGLSLLIVTFIFIPPEELMYRYNGTLVIFSLLAQWLYFTMMESSKYQATLGKIMLGVVVVDDRDERISWGKANARFWSKLISSILGIGYFMAIFTEYKQGLHDKIADTYVVNKEMLLYQKSNAKPLESTRKLDLASKGFNWPD
ncbi:MULTISPECIES: RDD family protein [Paenibacillus]|uniref:RDD family protein n=1 Tax=Paenibacillus woosongensis TaxID=307580 RepID=A0A7X3CMV1_9BACL|nr:RDD family protein [Paenibacillus woosongensis]MUG44340.1 RDD family protein [Paenibacillus woosongensis]